MPLNFVFSSIWHCKLIFLRNSVMNSMVKINNPHFRLIRDVDFLNTWIKKEAKEYLVTCGCVACPARCKWQRSEFPSLCRLWTQKKGVIMILRVNLRIFLPENSDGNLSTIGDEYFLDRMHPSVFPENRYNVTCAQRGGPIRRLFSLPKDHSFRSQ